MKLLPSPNTARGVQIHCATRGGNGDRAAFAVQDPLAVVAGQPDILAGPVCAAGGIAQRGRDRRQRLRGVAVAAASTQCKDACQRQQGRCCVVTRIADLLKSEAGTIAVRFGHPCAGARRPSGLLTSCDPSDARRRGLVITGLIVRHRHAVMPMMLRRPRDPLRKLPPRVRFGQLRSDQIRSRAPAARPGRCRHPE